MSWLIMPAWPEYNGNSISGKICMASKELTMRPKRRWFRKGNSEEIDAEILQPAHDVYENDQDFQAWAQQHLGIEPTQIQHTKEDVMKQIAAASEAHLEWLGTRGTGLKKLSSTSQSFFTRFANFLAAYSGIVEFVRSASCPYGDVAYGTLSLLLTVVVNKSRNDENIAKALGDMLSSLPRLDLLKNIYPQPRVQVLVAEVFRDLIIFARTAVVYYTEAFSRVAAAATPPQELEFNIRIENLRQKVEEVNDESSVLLHERVKHIEEKEEKLLEEVAQLKAQNDDLLQGNEALRSQTKILQAQNNDLKTELKCMRNDSLEQQAYTDQQELANFRDSLGVPEACPHTDLQYCKQNLMVAFPTIVGSKPRKFATRYSQMTSSLLEKEESFGVWMRCAHSCLLLLGGKTVLEGRSDDSTCSWLSPAAMYIAERQYAEMNTVAFQCCEPQNLSVERSLQEVILSLSYQVLTWKPEILRKSTRIRSLLRMFIGRHDSVDILEMAFRILSDLLAEVDSKEPVYIILDRADKCKVSPFKLLRKLVEVIPKAKCMVKMVVVMDSSTFGSIDYSMCELLKQESNPYIVGRLDWDQERLGPEDLLSLHSR